jgi:Ankyrin repeats (many copies)/Ankyrin repeat
MSFAEAVAAIDAGDIETLRRLLAAQPELIRERTNLEEPYHYFSGATLLHHVAGNPDRETGYPANIVDVARLLLESGADVHARTFHPNGGTTMALVITSRQASDANASGPLIDLLLAHGAELDLGDLTPPLANHAPRAAEKMLDLGAPMTLNAAAALGRIDLVREVAAGASRDAIGLALLFAYVNRKPDVVEYLLGLDGNWNMTGVNIGTALHRAASAGDLPMVQRLVARGADVNDRNNPFHGRPLDWAEHAGQHEVAQWLRPLTGS